MVIGTIIVSTILVVILLGITEVVLRLIRAAPTPGSLVLSESLGWDRTPPVERPIPATAPPKTPGAEPLRILFMGDSFTHNTAWSRLVIEELNRRGIAATGWEAGVSGYGQVQEALKLESLLPEMRPDLTLLLFYGWNDPRDNSPAPGIFYNPNMLGRPYLEADGSVTLPSSFGMSVRNFELFRLGLENWWYRRELKASRKAMDPGGADAIAAPDSRLLTIYSDPLTWMPLYQPSAQNGAYIQRVWSDTERALRRIKDACAANGSALIVIGIDAPFTIDRDVFDMHIVTDPRYRADDFDTGLPLTRFATTARSLGLEPVLPAPALAAYAKEVDRKIYDGGAGNLTGHLLPDAQEVMARVVADAIERSLQATPPRP